ncbi:formylglycine-generating enzyme family protein [Thermodesulfobacteriota bacterium]
MIQGTRKKNVFLIIILSLFALSCERGNPQKGNAFTNSFGVQFIYIKPGEFVMGSPASEPERHYDEIQHRVTLIKGFYLGMTEVTQEQWRKVMGNNPSSFTDCGENCPVDSVSWYDVQKFIQKLNDSERGTRYRLPSEAEWEYACRSGTVTHFNTGNCLSTSQANFDGRMPLPDCPGGRYRESPVPVAMFPANGWRLFDMHGNVWEWCQDWYGKKPTGDVVDPVGPLSGKYKVIRGGAWHFMDHDCRSANRDRSHPDRGLNTIGFRLVCEQDR